MLIKPALAGFFCFTFTLNYNQMLITVLLNHRNDSLYL